MMNNRGQTTLVIVVLVMVVSLAVGIAASSRAISNIRKVSYTSQGDQAFHCAESGAEDGLNIVNEAMAAGGEPVLGDYSAENLSDTQGVDICSYKFNISEFADDVLDYPLVLQDDVQEVNLRGYSGSLDIYFGSDENASLEVTFVIGDSAPYTVEKHGYNCTSRDNGFDDALDSSEYDLPCKTDSFSIDGSYQIARLRPLYASTRIVAEFQGTSPPQGYVINSTGIAGPVQRKVEVIRTLPQMPGIFDFAIFSEGSLEK